MYIKQTFYTMLIKTMGDLYRETERCIECVKRPVVTCTPIMRGCSGISFAKQTEVKGHVDIYSLSSVQSIYPYVCESKHYSVDQLQCLIGYNFRGIDVSLYEGLIKCTFLAPRGCTFFSCLLILTAS